MRNMVNDLLDFSKLQNKEYHLETELLNLSGYFIGCRPRNAPDCRSEVCHDRLP